MGIEQLRQEVKQLGAWAFLAVGALRLTSIIIPALSGTAYSVLAGGLFGFVPGLITICLADLISCSLSFCLSRKYGRGDVFNPATEEVIGSIPLAGNEDLDLAVTAAREAMDGE